MDAETREIIERLQALGDNPMLHETAQTCTGCIDNFSQQAGNNIFRGFIIDLLERSDPDEWTDEQLCEWGLVRLPRDKDGEVIRIGDTVWDDNDNPYEWTVIGIGIGDVAPHFPIRCANKQFETGFKTEQITHRPPVTVESVLREFGDKYIQVVESPNPIVGFGNEIIGEEDPEKTIAEYAKRLQLAEVDDDNQADDYYRIRDAWPRIRLSLRQLQALQHGHSRLQTAERAISDRNRQSRHYRVRYVRAQGGDEQ